jgi:hypothetical protein
MKYLAGGKSDGMAFINDWLTINIAVLTTCLMQPSRSVDQGSQVEMELDSPNISDWQTRSKKENTSPRQRTGVMDTVSRGRYGIK